MYPDGGDYVNYENKLSCLGVLTVPFLLIGYILIHPMFHIVCLIYMFWKFLQ